MRELLDQEDADAGRGDGLERRREPLDDDRREAERELVDEQDHARLRDERLREHDHLLLAAGEQAAGDRPALLELGEQLERVRDPALGLLPLESEYVATRRLSSTVSSGSSRRPSGTTATPAPRICSGRRRVRSSVAEQDAAGARRAARPPTASTSVDLPAPFGPSSVVTSPGGISSETSCSTGRPPRGDGSSALEAQRAAASTRRRRSSRRQLLLGAEVGAHHVLVAQHLGGRAGRDQLAEVEHRGRRAAGRDEAHVVVDEDHQRAELLRDALDHPRQVLGLLVGEAGGRLVEQHDPAARRRRRGRSRPGGARGRRARRPCVRRRLEADEVDRLEHVGACATRGSRPECSWIIATLSNTDSCAIACSVWNVRRSPQRARR